MAKKVKGEKEMENKGMNKKPSEMKAKKRKLGEFAFGKKDKKKKDCY